VGLPGQTLQIKDKVILLDGKPMEQPEEVQFNYRIYTKNRQILSDEICNELGISDEDRVRVLDHVNGMPLTQSSLKALSEHKELIDSIVEIKDHQRDGIYPLNHRYGWTSDNYGPVWIPAKGKSVELNMENIAVYDRPIRVYEGNDLVVKDGKIFINGEEATSYTFKMDYYWMMGDNRHNSADSRFWGFVPEDHVVGKPLFVWLSISPDENPSSRIRWNRLFKWVGDIK
jgi:signal peptidase I